MKALAAFAAACTMAAAQYFSPTPHGTMPAANVTGNGVIEGTVVNEITREPMKKVMVHLMGRIRLIAVSDAAGRFAFKDLAAGQYTLQAQPVGNMGPRQNTNRNIQLEADQNIGDITLMVAPPASISGRVVDEDGTPLQYCNVAAITMRQQNARRMAEYRASSQTDASGNYQIDRVPSGKYYVMASCQRRVVLPHPLMDRGSPDIPMERYPPLLYPGSATLENARRMPVQPGANVSGIDFQMTPLRGVTVKGRIRGELPDMLQGGISITLRLSGELSAIIPQDGARVDTQSGTFHFTAVLPGSYELVATAPGAFARMSLNVGATPPDPVDLTLAPLPSLSGSVRVDGDAKISLSDRQINLNPLENQQLLGPTNAQTKEDGSFNIANVPPGRWGLFVSGDGYIKSMRMNDQDVSPDSFELASGTPINSVRIVLGTNWAQVEGTVSALPARGMEISGILLREGQADAPWNQTNRPFLVDSQGHFKLDNVAPGKYRVCVAEASDFVSRLLQNVDLRQKIKSRCEAVEVDEGGHATLQLTAISADDFNKLVSELDDQ